MRILVLPNSRPKAECPYQVSFIKTLHFTNCDFRSIQQQHPPIKQKLKAPMASPANETDIETLATLIGKNQPLIGLDLGTKTIGIAVSDLSLTIATARTTIRRTKFTKDVAELLEIADGENAAALVLGLPINMDGSEGPRAQATRAFARNLGQKTDLPIAYWDERLSTVAAERAMLEADLSRRKRAKKIDQVAASFILQGFLDRLSTIRSHVG
jgi:putative Holliday junction resolvase